MMSVYDYVPPETTVVDEAPPALRRVIRPEAPIVVQVSFVYPDESSLTVTSAPSTEAARIEAMEGAARTSLARYLMLRQGWDGYDGERFEHRTLQKASDLIAQIAAFFKSLEVAPSDISTAPASDGSVDVEIEFGDSRMLFIIYPDTSNVIVYHETPSDKPYETSFPIGDLPLEQLLHSLMAPEALRA